MGKIGKASSGTYVPDLEAVEPLHPRRRCPACDRPFLGGVQPQKAGFLSRDATTLLLVCLAAFAAVVFTSEGNRRSGISALESPARAESTERLGDTNNTLRCPGSIIYNRPAKTASTKIIADIEAWGRKVNRPVYKCSAFERRNAMQVRECIPDDKSGCAIVAQHMVLSDTFKSILMSRIGPFKLVSSTRSGRDRIVSRFLQLRNAHAGKAQVDLDGLKAYLRNFNPWTLYNYHTGKGRFGSCPLASHEQTLLHDAVNQVDVVIDADVLDVSNVILKANGLFQLAAGDRRNVRNSKDVTLDEEAEELLRNRSCVEEAMHGMFRLRMASMYQQITKKNCISNERHPKPCF